MPDLFEAIGTEIRVNGGQFSYFGQQRTPQIVRLANGDSLVVFESDSLIKAQRYDSAGSPIGPETFVTNGTGGYCNEPAVAALSSGGYAIAYSFQPSSGAAREVYVRIYDAAGAAAAPVQVAAAMAGAEQSPVIAALPGGGFVVVWTNLGQDGDGLGVFMQRFDAAGIAVSAEVQVNVGSTANQSDPAIAVLDGGGFVVVWRSESPDGFISGEIVARQYDASGTALGGEIAVNLTTLADQTQPAVTALAGGGFGIVWTSVNQDRPGGTGIVMQRFDASGTRIGSETIVNSFADGRQDAPAIARLDSDDFVVSWTSAVHDGSQTGVYAQVYSSAGLPQGEEFRASTTTTGSQSTPALAAATGGGFTLVYQSPDGSFDGIYLQRYASSAGLADLSVTGTLSVSEAALGATAVASLATNQTNDATTYTIVSDSSGGAFGIVGDQLVVADNGWLDFETQTAVTVTVRALSSNGQQIDQQVTVQVTNAIDEVRFSANPVHSEIAREGGTIDVTALSNGGFALVWRDQVQVFNPFLNAYESQNAIIVRVLDADGAVINQTQQLLTNQLTVSSPVITATSGNSFVVGWSAEFGSNNGLSLQFFDGNGNAAAAPQLAIPGAVTRDGPAELITLANGDLLAINSHYDSGSAQYNVMVRRFAADGTVLDAGTTAISGPAGATFMSAIALPDGGYVLDYAQTIPGTSGSRNFLQRFDASGAALGTPQQVGSDALTVPPPDLALLAGGGMVVAWSGTATYPDFNTYVQLFNASGVPLGAPQIIDPDPGTSSAQVSVIGLPDGGFVVQWMTLTGPKLMRFDANGTALLDAPQHIGGQYALQNGFSLAATADGDFISVWIDPNGDTTTGNYDQTWQTFGFESLYGSESADTLTGTATGELSFGYGGDDTLIGGGGVDTLYGGSGNDRLVVGATGTGSFINGGSGTDTLAINGTVSLGSLTGIEAVELFGGAALTLTGAQFNAGLAVNAAFSGTGSLTVNMTAGEYFFATQMSFASSIVTTVNGTSGVDVIKAALDASIIAFGGDETDQIRGGNLADSIFGDGGNDKIMGLGGADQLTGGTGADQFRYLFTTDSGLGVGADRVLDFTNGEDKLDFRALDADPNTAGRQALSFIGTAAFGATGSAQLRYADSGGDTLVQIDLNGDGAADMEIVLVGHAGQALTGTDFLL